ncbi:hypothetical protein VPH35_000444 [Triticum aestivum]
MDGHRRAPRQILVLEEAFKKCPHPDQTQVANLSRETGMEVHQIQYWFQTRRAQIKGSSSNTRPPTKGSSSPDP